MENVNDWSTLLTEGTYWNDNPSTSLVYNDPRKAWFIDEDDLRNKKVNIGNDTYAKMKDAQQNAIRTLVAVCRANGIEPILMTQAHRFILSPPSDDPFYYELKTAMREYNLTYDIAVRCQLDFNKNIRNVALETNTKLIDLDSALSYKKEYIYDIVHYNNSGSTKAAEIIADYLSGFFNGLGKDPSNSCKVGK